MGSIGNIPSWFSYRFASLNAFGLRLSISKTTKKYSSPDQCGSTTDMIALVVIVRRNSPHDASDHFADPGNKSPSGPPNSDKHIVDRV